MMGHPADDKFAFDCLKLWGLRQRSGGPKAYPNKSAFVLRARGVEVTWSSSHDEVVGSVVARCLSDEHKQIVKLYFEPQADPRKNGEYRQCNMTLTIAKLKAYGVKADRNAVNEALDRAVGKCAIALSYPPAVWLELQNTHYSKLDKAA